MDADRFDSLARSLTPVGTRRRALGAALSGALVALAVVKPSTAGKKGGEPKKKICICTSDSCSTKKKSKDSVKKLVKRNPCASVGRCTGVNPCARTVPPPAPECATFRDCSNGQTCLGGKCGGQVGPGCSLDTDCEPIGGIAPDCVMVGARRYCVIECESAATDCPPDYECAGGACTPSQET